MPTIPRELNEASFGEYHSSGIKAFRARLQIDDRGISDDMGEHPQKSG